MTCAQVLKNVEPGKNHQAFNGHARQVFPGETLLANL